MIVFPIKIITKVLAMDSGTDSENDSSNSGEDGK